MALYKQQERLCRDLEKNMDFRFRWANILFQRGDLDGVMALHIEAERLCREMGDKNDGSALRCASLSRPLKLVSGFQNVTIHCSGQPMRRRGTKGRYSSIAVHPPARAEIARSGRNVDASPPGP